MYIQVQVTVPNQELGRKIAAQLLAENLAACVQILGPIQSHYVWKGKEEQTQEFLLLIKTQTAYYPKIEHLVLDLHPYEVPELIYSALQGGLPSYFKWIDEQLEE